MIYRQRLTQVLAVAQKPAAGIRLSKSVESGRPFPHRYLLAQKAEPLT